MEIKKINNFYKNKKVLVIGHTGFKGSWLSISLQKMGSKVYGISLNVPTKLSHFKMLNFKNSIKDFRLDIRNYDRLKRKILLIKPDIIFHLAAQSLVKKSYSNPHETWTTNLLGTLNLFDILKNLKLKRKMSVIVITSDKCYKNLNQKKKYLETDLLGDSEPYGASKAAVEVAFRSYFDSFFYKKKKLNIASARAGNVIGGGDWSDNRIIPDCYKSWSKNKKAIIRNPNSTRPWQHVLEAVYGYLVLAIKLKKNSKLHGEAFNFGPNTKKNYKVKELIDILEKNWEGFKWKNQNSKNLLHESNLLKLNSKKAEKILGWKTRLQFKETILMTANWYKEYLLKSKKMLNISIEQIKYYQNNLKI